ncbi:MAG: AbrB/MazE/SpoVT family DNA-binding domain-containing protein [Chloroflexi bacterium]|nr:AbrB/MazE/SpoVT family DNA-binding domain-containing protein [Chloroflexota bacterium]
MVMAKVTSKGQVTLPKEVRDALGLIPGTHVEFQVEPGRIVMRKRIPPEVFKRWRGYLRDKVGGLTTDELLLELRGEVDGVK